MADLRLEKATPDNVTVTWAEGEGGPEEFSLRLGFRRTGEMSGDQVVGELDLARA